ncbi:hypothetical protein [Agromyces laixinhei]|uniref:hypothetical protein n=1 Tax=Agromyces laixinhei TaxID=2585717 RepID=UPI0012ED5D8D|nr:hypothetical protein [Agromyces laixinhei]
MPEPTDDERVRRLQRTAFGAGAGDDERAAAVAELEALRRVGDGERDGGPSADPADDSSRAPADRAHLMPVPPPSAPGHVAARGESRVRGLDAASARRFRLAIGAVTVTLLVGVTVGWQFGARTAHSPAENAAPTAGAPFEAEVADAQTLYEYVASRPFASETPAAGVFSRPVTAADAPPAGAAAQLGVGELDFRLLEAHDEGLRLYAVRDNIDVCLFAAFATGAMASACTAEGRFPTEGITLKIGAPDILDRVDATWLPDGTLQLRDGSN